MNNVAFVPFKERFFAVWGSDGCAVTFNEAAFLHAMRTLSHARAAECSTEEEARSLAVRMYGGELVHRYFSRRLNSQEGADILLMAGTKRLVKREKMEKFLDKTLAV